MTSEVNIDDFATAHAAGAAVIDVREPDEYAAGHVPGAVLIPLGQLAARLDEVPKGGPVYLICASGGRSGVAADALSAQGLEAISVAGGTIGWRRSGRPVETAR